MKLFVSAYLKLESSSANYQSKTEEATLKRLSEDSENCETFSIIQRVFNKMISTLMLVKAALTYCWTQ